MARSEEARIDPTPRRLAAARRRGEVAQSRDLVSAVALLAAVVTLVVQGPASAARLTAYMRAALAAAPAESAGVGPALAAGLAVTVRVLAAPLAAAALSALVVGLVQTGGLVALGAVRFDLARLSPAAGLRRALGAPALRQVGKGLLKVAIVGTAVWFVVRPLLGGVPALAGAPVPRVAALLGVLAGRLALYVALAALVVGAADYLLARHLHVRGLRMTRDEVRRESKEAEGDPTHRAERARLHRELAEQRMVADVRSAELVVINRGQVASDQIAVALRYDKDGDGAPVVVARGERLLADRIRAAARDAGVPIFPLILRDAGLARSLRGLDEGAEIPVALYEAIAELFRAVYAAAPPPTGVVPSLSRGAGWQRV